MKTIYEAIISKNGNYYEASFPDLGIVTQGDSLEDAVYMAQDLLENYIIAVLSLGKTLPAPTFGHECPDGSFRFGIMAVCDESTPQDETMSVNEAADVLGVTPARIRAMIQSGILKSHKVGRVHMVDAQSVMDRFNAPVHAGRPSSALAEA